MQEVTILRAQATTDMPEIGIKHGDIFYITGDGQDGSPSARFRIVKWERIRWVCSCGKGACEHKLMVNTFVFELSQKRSITRDDLVPYVEDELRINRY